MKNTVQCREADGLDVSKCSMVSQDPSFYLSECDRVVLTNHIYNFSLLFGCVNEVKLLNRPECLEI